MHYPESPKVTSYALTRQHLTDKTIVHHQRDNLIFSYTLKPVYSSQTTIRSTQTKTVEKIDTAADRCPRPIVLTMHL